MTVFVCAGCGAVLTARLSRVALPDHAHQSVCHDLLPALLEPGTYAVDPRPAGSGIGIAPGDLRGTAPIKDRCSGSCYGLDGGDGPNLACAGCGLPVAARVDDCSLWQVVWLLPDAVRAVAVAGPALQVLAWEALRDEYPRTLPGEPWWEPIWEAAIGTAMAHLLAASGGTPPIVPDGPLADLFGRPVAALFKRARIAAPPIDRPARTLALAGPGLPASDADILLVPRHPQTGEVWPSGAARVVPLAAEVWTYLAYHDDRRLTLAVPGMPGGVLRDEPWPSLPPWYLWPDRELLRRTLARLPAIRLPWLRAIHDVVHRL